MKDVPDWTVGTLWGSKVFRTLPDSVLPDGQLMEYYAHRPINDNVEYIFPDRWT
jgi:hypothetical protein